MAGMRIGVSGRQYGLSVKKKKTARPVLSSVFGGEADDDETDTNDAVTRQAQAIKEARKTQALHARAVEEDPSVFEYDEVYDPMRKERGDHEAQKLEERRAKKPKYMKQLLQKAKEREREFERVKTALAHKEIEQSKELYGETPKFVTRAYKEHLVEQKRWEAEEAERVAREEDVTKKGMGSFFRNLLSNNVSMGTADETELKKKEQEQDAEMQAEEERTREARMRIEEQRREDREEVAASDGDSGASSASAADVPLTVGFKRKREQELKEKEEHAKRQKAERQAAVEAARQRALERLAARKVKS